MSGNQEPTSGEEGVKDAIPSCPAVEGAAPSKIVYLQAKASVVRRFNRKKRLLREYAKELKQNKQLTVAQFLRQVAHTAKKGAWIPTDRCFSVWLKDQAKQVGADVRLPRRRGPNGRTRIVTEAIMQIYIDVKAVRYPTEGARKQPRDPSGQGFPWHVFVWACTKQGITKIPSQREMQRSYARLPEAVRMAPEMTLNKFRNKYGAKSTNVESSEFVVQMDYQVLDYIQIQRSPTQTYKLQLAVAVERSTGCILAPTLFEHSLLTNTLKSIIFNVLTFESDRNKPSFLQVDRLEIDGDPANVAVQESNVLQAALGMDIEIGRSGKPFQRGKVENKHRYIQRQILPGLEAVIREFCTKGGGFIVREKEIEQVYAVAQAFIAKFAALYNSGLKGRTGKTRIQLFNEKYGDSRIKCNLEALLAVSKSHILPAKAVEQVELTMDDRKVRIQNPGIVLGETYNIIHVLGSEDMFFIYDLDGNLLGPGIIPRPNTVHRDKLESRSNNVCAEIHKNGTLSRRRGALFNAQFIDSLPEPKDGMRPVLRSPTLKAEARKNAEGIREKKPSQRVSTPTPRLIEQTVVESEVFEIEDFGAFNPMDLH